MIDDEWTRKQVAKALANSLDTLVRDRMTGMVEEPDITSRIGQRLEDAFNGRDLHGFRVRVVSETMPSHGRGSLEKPTGTDLYIALSIENQFGEQTKKGILVQAKREDKLNWPDLREQCRRMRKVTKKGSVVWVYRQDGIGVMRTNEVLKHTTPVIDADDFFERVLACKIGDKTRVPTAEFRDRSALRAMLEKIGARNAVWLDLEEKSAERPARR